MHTYIYICTYTYIYIYISIYTYTHTHTHTHTHIYIHIYLSIYLRRFSRTHHVNGLQVSARIDDALSHLREPPPRCRE